MPQGANNNRPQPGQPGSPQTGNPYQVTENRFWNFVPATGTKPPEMLLYGPIASQRSWWEDREPRPSLTRNWPPLGTLKNWW